MRKSHGLMLLLALAAGLFVGCGDDGVPLVDGGIDAAMPPADAGEDRPQVCVPREIRWSQSRVELLVGTERTATISLRRDFCEDIALSLAGDSTVVRFVESATIPANQSDVLIELEGLAIGETTIVAEYTDRLTEERFEASLTVVVADETLPSCEGMAQANLVPGAELRLGGDLDNVGVALPEGAGRDDEYHVDAFDASVGCAADQVPAGYRALGPAVEIGPDYARFPRELPVTIPVKLALLPSGANLNHVEFSYTGSGVDEARIVPVAGPDFESHPGFVTFAVPRLGTYQVVARETAGSTREREFSFRGITGISMGSGGSSLIGIHNPERFDFVAPLGGPVDWIHLADYIRTYHTGGFCNEEQREADPVGCAAGASIERTPPSNLLYQHRQDYEHWWYEDEWKGHGGTFDRDEYIKIFRDLATMYGNPNSTRTPVAGEVNITPPGIDDSVRERSNADRCANPVVIPPFDSTSPEGTGFFDDEYNSEGQHPVITFCDGGELPNPDFPRGRDIGVWDPEQAQPDPMEVVLAVDIDGDGIRDPGEPVIRQGRENYEDCGLDQLCNEDEPGYDAVTNPDPAGDDYDFQYNPTGTEGNALRDYVGDAVGDCTSPEPNPAAGVGEVFFDTGLDGVAGTAQLTAGGFDIGEGDGCWTLSRGLAHMFANNPRSFVLEAEEEVLQDLDFFGDGGIRDLFNFATNQDQLAGAFSARGFPVRLFNTHSSLAYTGPGPDADFSFTGINWNNIGQFVQVRYGTVDASEGDVIQGDGQHVGTPAQVLNRLLSVMGWMSARWPGGDRRRVSDQICGELSATCEHINHFSFEFTSPTTGRTGPAAVVLPPGYFDPENADLEYPVVYLLHGYGQEPEDLIATGIIIWTFMSASTIPEAQRLQKMIFVFPDGRCREQGGERECVKGTFYANAPAGQGAQMETWLLELMDHMDENYRTRTPETYTVVE